MPCSHNKRTRPSRQTAGDPLCHRRYFIGTGVFHIKNNISYGTVPNPVRSTYHNCASSVTAMCTVRDIPNQNWCVPSAKTLWAVGTVHLRDHTHSNLGASFGQSLPYGLTLADITRIIVIRFSLGRKLVNILPVVK